MVSPHRPSETAASPSDPLWRRAVGPLVVVGAVLVANILALAGVVDVSPLGPVGITASATQAGFLPGQWFTDPNIGWTAQALGHLAATDWLHGIVPWWNPYEGLGAPLAAGMQSAALFPPTLLLALSNGQLYFHLVLESIAGLATWLLVRELGLGRGVATLGGMLFALNGTFAWFGHAPVNPVPFLPLMLLGIERLARRRRFDHAGWLLIAIGIALSLYGGFPEVAYLDGLLALVWAIVRLVGRREIGRLRFAGGIAGAAVVGTLLSAPLALPFAKYLPLADVGQHAGAVGVKPFTGHQVAVVGLPYLYGPIAAFIKYDRSALGNYWGMSGGYVTAAMLVLATIGLLAGRGPAGLRRMLAVVAVLVLCWQLNVPAISEGLTRIIPLTKDVLTSRYLPPIWELPIILLACHGLDAIVHSPKRLWGAVLAGTGVAVAVLCGDLVAAWSTIRTVYRLAPSYHIYPVAMVAWAGGLTLLVGAVALVRVPQDPWATPRRSDDRPAVATAAPVSPAASSPAPVSPAASSPAHLPSPATRGPAAALRAPRAPRPAWLRRHAGAVVGALLALDGIVMFALPQLSAPRSVTIDTKPAKYLAAHLGNGRFFSLWVYHPDYGAYFGLASIDSDNLPVPKAWAAYVREHLASNANPLKFDGQRVPRPNGPSAVRQLRDNLAAYEAVDVRYVVSVSAARPFGRVHGDIAADGVRRVFDDRRYAIWALPTATPLFSSSGCSLQSNSSDAVVATCTRPATLLRSELDLPGWSATVGGRPAALHKTASGLMSLQVPAGRSEVAFSYWPPGETVGLLLFAVGLLAAIGVPLGASVLSRAGGLRPHRRGAKRALHGRRRGRSEPLRQHGGGGSPAGKRARRPTRQGETGRPGSPEAPEPAAGSVAEWRQATTPSSSSTSGPSTPS